MIHYSLKYLVQKLETEIEGYSLVFSSLSCSDQNSLLLKMNLSLVSGNPKVKLKHLNETNNFYFEILRHQQQDSFFVLGP